MKKGLIHVCVVMAPNGEFVTESFAGSEQLCFERIIYSWCGLRRWGLSLSEQETITLWGAFKRKGFKIVKIEIDPLTLKNEKK